MITVIPVAACTNQNDGKLPVLIYTVVNNIGLLGWPHVQLSQYQYADDVTTISFMRTMSQTKAKSSKRLFCSPSITHL